MSDFSPLIEQIQSLIQNQEARLSVVVATGYDEAALVGTKDAYLRLVREVLQFLASAEDQQVDRLQVGEMQLPSSSNIGDLFDPRCEIELDTTTLTASEEETTQVVDYFFWLSPPSPTNLNDSDPL